MLVDACLTAFLGCVALLFATFLALDEAALFESLPALPYGRLVSLALIQLFLLTLYQPVPCLSVFF